MIVTDNEAWATELQDIDEFVGLHWNHSCLDGYFTAIELRRIADAMDELKRAKEA